MVSAVSVSGNAPSEVQVLPYLYNRKKLDWRMRMNKAHKIVDALILLTLIGWMIFILVVASEVRV